MAIRELTLTHYQAGMVLAPVKGEVREVVRITVFGPDFPERAVAPEILVGEAPAESVSVARDQRSIRGFLPQMPAEGAVIRVRYGDSQEGVLGEPFRRDQVRALPKECQ
ncbi:MAG TPA: hypothetical protein VKF41_04505 [Bryobacteraceae bacterium]|nr:hypothetical protein [Bryobacteraceae bacterium]